MPTYTSLYFSSNNKTVTRFCYYSVMALQKHFCSISINMRQSNDIDESLCTNIGKLYNNEESMFMCYRDNMGSAYIGIGRFV